MAETVSIPDAGEAFIYFYLTARALCCCVQAFSSCRDWRLLSSCGAKASPCSASLGAGHRLRAQGLQQSWLPGSRAQARSLWHRA